LGCSGLAAAMVERYWGNPVPPAGGWRRDEPRQGWGEDGARASPSRGIPLPSGAVAAAFRGRSPPRAPRFPRGSHLPVGQPFEAVVHRQHPVPVDEADAHGRPDGRVHAGGRGAHVEHGQRVTALRGQGSRRWGVVGFGGVPVTPSPLPYLGGGWADVCQQLVHVPVVLETPVKGGEGGCGSPGGGRSPGGWPEPRVPAGDGARTLTGPAASGLRRSVPRSSPSSRPWSAGSKDRAGGSRSWVGLHHAA